MPGLTIQDLARCMYQLRLAQAAQAQNTRAHGYSSYGVCGILGSYLLGGTGSRTHTSNEVMVGSLSLHSSFLRLMITLFLAASTSRIRPVTCCPSMYLLGPRLLLTFAVCIDGTSALHSMHSILGKEYNMCIQSSQGYTLVDSSFAAETCHVH